MVSHNTKSWILLGMLVVVSVSLWIMVSLPPPEIEMPGIIPEVEIEIELPEMTMHRGETKTIPIIIRINTGEPTHAKLWVYSTDLEDISAEPPIDIESLEESFEEIKKRSVDDGFSVLLDEQEFQIASDQNTKIVNLTLRTSEDVKKGEYRFVYPLYTKSFSLEQVRYATFHVTVE